MRIQTRFIGKHRPRSAAHLDDKIRRKLQRLASQFDCSESFVESTILAEALDIDLGEKYYEPKGKFDKRNKSSNSKVGNGKGGAKVIAIIGGRRRY